MTAIDTLDPYAWRAVLDLLRHMAEADGEVSDEERDALRGAEIALGFPDPGVFPDDVVLSTLRVRDRMLAFAACAWMMFADGIRDRRESRFLEWLADHFRLGDETARFLVSHARWVRVEHDLPWYREVDLLLTEGARRIAAVERRAAA